MSRLFCTMSTSSAPLISRRMVQFHTENQALATLAVQDRETSRYLLFDEQLQLCGRRVRARSENGVGSVRATRESPGFLRHPRYLSSYLCDDEGGRRLLHHPRYLRLAAQGEKILAFRADEYYWRDLGRLDDLMKAAQDMEHGVTH